MANTINVNKLKTANDEKNSKLIESKLQNLITSILDQKVEDLNIDIFRNKILQAKIGMEYLRDIDLNFRIRFAQKLRIVTMIGEDPDKRRKLISAAFKK